MDIVVASLFCIVIVLLFAKMWQQEQEFVDWLKKEGESNESI